MRQLVKLLVPGFAVAAIMAMQAPVCAVAKVAASVINSADEALITEFSAATTHHPTRRAKTKHSTRVSKAVKHRASTRKAARLGARKSSGKTVTHLGTRKLGKIGSVPRSVGSNKIADGPSKTSAGANNLGDGPAKLAAGPGKIGAAAIGSLVIKDATATGGMKTGPGNAAPASQPLSEPASQSNSQGAARVMEPSANPAAAATSSSAAVTASESPAGTPPTTQAANPSSTGPQAPGAMASAAQTTPSQSTGTPGTSRQGKAMCLEDGSCLGASDAHITPGTPSGVAAATAAVVAPGSNEARASETRAILDFLKQRFGLPPGASSQQLLDRLADKQLNPGGGAIRDAVVDDLLNYLKQRYGLSPGASNDRLRARIDEHLGMEATPGSGINPDKTKIRDALAAFTDPRLARAYSDVQTLWEALLKKADDLRNRNTETANVWLARHSLPPELDHIVKEAGGFTIYFAKAEEEARRLAQEYDDLQRRWTDARYKAAELELAIQQAQ